MSTLLTSGGSNSRNGFRRLDCHLLLPRSSFRPSAGPPGVRFTTPGLVRAVRRPGALPREPEAGRGCRRGWVRRAPPRPRLTPPAPPPPPSAFRYASAPQRQRSRRSAGGLTGFTPSAQRPSAALPHFVERRGRARHGRFVWAGVEKDGLRLLRASGPKREVFWGVGLGDIEDHHGTGDDGGRKSLVAFSKGLPLLFSLSSVVTACAFTTRGSVSVPHPKGFGLPPNERRRE